ncbi:hypothetical protein CFIMG_006322RAa [Ceratocystis fimbriata CBS 114723]|uniref:Uncharacterized protein n=1 Tax=Ceratocystis fimbriata CBS 114723 TaxID=1035309 RepID=A0A2C5WUW3_9PEZI|nr:hypothetical protein CFIMG_006322RAa [Ceratocystis fimbriata CBS 114723]
MAPILSSAPVSEKSGLPLPAVATSTSPFPRPTSPSQRRRSFFTVTMRASLIALFGLICLGAALAPRVPCNHDLSGDDQSHGHVDAVADLPDGPAVDESAFSSMLNSASPEHLHKLLHSHLPGMYRHGVYESGRHAAEMLHRTDARLATSLVRMAKRQSNSSSVVTEPSSTEQTTQLPTETDTSSQAETASESTPTPTSTTEENSDTTITEAPTTLTSTTPTLVTSESLTTFTSTDAAGNVHVVTSTAMVVVRPSSTSSSASATSTPDLQNAASRPAAGAMVVPAVLVMAAVGGFLAL